MVFSTFCHMTSILQMHLLRPKQLVVTLFHHPKNNQFHWMKFMKEQTESRKKLFVDSHERERIKEETKQQSGSHEWFEARKIRITASKCKRAIQRPTTSPTKAMIEILHLKENFQSEKCLVEVKRIFPGTMTLEEAVCRRGICKKSSNGLIVNQKHAYFYQVQQQLFCSGFKYEDLVLSDLKEIIVLSIKRCSSFSIQCIPKLQVFYDQFIALELAYPRVALGLPRLGKAVRGV